MKQFRAATAHLPRFPALSRASECNILQVNIGKLCNLVCRHCHVESSPSKRRENMNRLTVDRCLELLRDSPTLHTLDLTGGAPELNPHFRYMVEEARKLGREVIDRCNLVVLYERGLEDLPAFLAEQRVQVVASLPCYSVENTDRQRGRGVFKDSVSALQLLNEHGYGREGGPELHLVYNPGGASLPGPQQELEARYRQELRELFGIEFNRLFTITNQPIKRFADDLLHAGAYTAYMELLVKNYSEATVPALMCRNTLNVQWDGTLFDCDFNGALEMPIRGAQRQPLTVFDLANVSELDRRAIRTDLHCYACTAGQGSSCGGALSTEPM